VLTVPSDIYGQMVEKRFGISVQGWGSWARDWALEQVVSLISGERLRVDSLCGNPQEYAALVVLLLAGFPAARRPGDTDHTLGD